MKPSRFRTFSIGVTLGVIYAFFGTYIASARFGETISTFINSTRFEPVSVGYMFILPIALGAIPALLSTKEELLLYKTHILTPWVIVMTFSILSVVRGLEGLLCLAIGIGPFVLMATLGSFIVRFIKLRRKGNGTPLHAILFMPFVFFGFEKNFTPKNEFYVVSSKIEIEANKIKVWENVKNVKNIKPEEISTHFIHWIGIPKPLDGRLDKEAVGGIRKITWEKGISFTEEIKVWEENRFAYDIIINPDSIPPQTLDDHVLIGGKYFDVVEGGYSLEKISESKVSLTLVCKYRITTNLNFYGKWWADFILEDFNLTILEVIKKRSESSL